jgi:ribosomal protein L37AE/L43A
MAKKKQKAEVINSNDRLLACPVCLSDNLDAISVRMKKCQSCGFIWNHEVSDRDNLLLIMEHQTKRESPPDLVTNPGLQIPFVSKASRKKA